MYYTFSSNFQKIKRIFPILELNIIFLKYFFLQKMQYKYCKFCFACWGHLDLIKKLLNIDHTGINFSAEFYIVK